MSPVPKQIWLAFATMLCGLLVLLTAGWAGAGRLGIMALGAFILGAGFIQVPIWLAHRAELERAKKDPAPKSYTEYTAEEDAR